MNTTTAAVAANNDGSATAVAFSPQDLKKTQVNQPFRRNNAALKFLRDTNENRYAKPITDCVDLTYMDSIEIGVIEHDKKGQNYWFTKERQQWSWRQMLAGMRRDDQARVLGDPRNGVRRIWLAPIPASYDHNRATLWESKGWEFSGDVDEFLVWDFFVEREDGITRRFHPAWTTTKVSVSDGNVPPKGTPPPNGKGKKYKRGTHQRILRDNHPPVPAHGGAATPNGSEGGLDADIHGRGDADSYGFGDSDSFSLVDFDDVASDTPSFGGKDATVWATANAHPTQASGCAQEIVSPKQQRAASHSLTQPPHGFSGTPNYHQNIWDKDGSKWIARRSLSSISEGPE